MPNIRRPRQGSMQFYPRVRASRIYPRLNHQIGAEPLSEFAGYKAGMTHLTFNDNRPNSMTKGEEVAIPVTVIECPPLKVVGVRAYKGEKRKDYLAENLSKELARKIQLPKKKHNIDEIKDFDFLRFIVHTQPYLTTIGKKKPELFEVGIGGKTEEQLGKAKELFGKEIIINNVFSEGAQLDVHSITKGKGYQGPTKRFGIALRSHKSEKGTRGPGSLGGWRGQGHVMYRVAHAGQMGFHKRTELNKWLVRIGNDPKKINPKGGFLHYGIVKNHYMLVAGSVGGPAKRLIIFTKAQRPNKKMPKEAPQIQYVSLESKQ